MIDTVTPQPAPEYALERTHREYERLRVQARFWQAATERVLDRLDLAAGASCLDAGSGPGEVLRLLAERVGPTGRVTGIDVDAALNGLVEADLHADGLTRCRTLTARLTGDTPVPGGPYDLVYARLLLFHLPERVPVLRRLWEAVAPGGHLLVQDYDLPSATAVPTLPGVQEVTRLFTETFTAVGCEVRAGLRLRELFASAGIGEPDDTDVAGRLVPLGTGGAPMLEQVLRSVLPAALAHGVTTEPVAEAAIAALRHEATEYADRTLLWPLLIGAWRRKP